MTTKKRNPQDLTGRNRDALKKQIVALKADVKLLKAQAKQSAKVEKDVEQRLLVLEGLIMN